MRPPVPKYPTGPRCQGCPYRSTSKGFAPPQYVDLGPDGTDYRYLPAYEHADYMFLLERLGREEVAEGRNAVGGTGNILNRLLRKAGILRASAVLLNAVKCRPIVWTELDGKQVSLLKDNGDHVDNTPSPGQIHECAERYLDDDLAHFNGHTIVALGGTALRVMVGPRSIKKERGTIFEPGQLVPCAPCNGAGLIPGGDKRCPDCKAGKRKMPLCETCNKTGRVAKPNKRCSACKGGCLVPEDLGNPYICDKLKPHQLLFTSFHPIYLVKEPGLFVVAERDFARIPNLREELHVQSVADYDDNPGPGKVEEILLGEEISIDLEGPNAETYEGDITIFGLSDKPGRAVALPPSHEAVFRALQAPLVIGANFTLYDSHVLYQRGYPQVKKLWDIRGAGQILNPDTPNNLVYQTAEFARPPFRGYWKTEQNYRDNPELVVQIDADMARRVKIGQWEALVERGQLRLMTDDVIPICSVVMDMRERGVRTHRERMNHAAVQLELGLARDRETLPDWGGVRTEGQHVKVHEYLYERFKLPVQKDRTSGKVTAKEESLKKLSSLLETDHPSMYHLDEQTKEDAVDFIDLILSLREKQKLLSGFMRYQVDSSDRIYPIPNPFGTATMRFSYSRPNLQQVPDCDCEKEGRGPYCFGSNPDCNGARYVFLADHDDWELASLDIKQAEVLSFLWNAEEWNIIDRVLNHGEDVHQLVADKVGVTRKEGKTTTFAVLFGEAPRTTAARNQLTLDAVEDLRRVYFKAMPGVQFYRQTMIDHSMKYGYVEAPDGYRRYIRCTSTVGVAANKACNAPIQHMPSHIIRGAMVTLHSELPKPARIWGQAHDELILTYPKELRDKTLRLALDVLESPVKVLPAAPLGMASGLRFKIDCAVGPSWGELRDYRPEGRTSG